LLSHIASASPVPVYVRAHSLLNTGDGTPALKWGSTNAYTEDEHGNPIYDWTLVDKIIDAYIERGMKPLVEIGFMPKALSSKPEPYQHKWHPGARYEDIYTGWAYPPNDYAKWAELVYQWVQHSVQRYGKAEVETWLWELWNEPNIGYWQGTREEFFKLNDYTADAVKRALPSAKFGGPHSTGPSWDEAEKFLRAFLTHCEKGTNYVSGKKGTALDYISFHAKGRPEFIDGHVQMNMGTQLRDIAKGFEIVASYKKYKNTPIVIGESDPEGCAACSMDFYPPNQYTAAVFPRKLELADHYGVNFIGAVTWAFEFENQPWFRGFRDLATNGVDKPVLNVFRMFGMMQGERVAVNGDLAHNYLSIRDNSVRGERADISAYATANKDTVNVLLWHYHDDDVPAPAVPVTLNLAGLNKGSYLLHHYRVDQVHSNSYSAWQKMGSPAQPSREQIQQLEQAGQLHLYTSPQWLQHDEKNLVIEVEMPRQAVSLLSFRKSN
jgi:xylan 1,4-beta-xylosidase